MTTNDADKQVAVAVRAVYEGVLAAWNRRAAEEMAAPFAESCLLIGYDGSIMRSRAEIERSMAAIFADQATGAYVSNVRSAQFLAQGVVLLPAAAGFIPAGQSLQTCHCLQSMQSACTPT